MKQILQEKLDDLSERELQIVEKAIDAVYTMRQNKYPFMGNFMKLEKASGGENFRCSMPITRDVLNPYRIVYGGVTAMMADMAMGWMLEGLIGERDKVVTLDMHVNYHSPGVGKMLIASCQVISQAQNVISATCQIVNDKDDLVVSATGTFLHLKRGV
jgi:uncharacterized protein (TIGR00369 family)